MMINELYSQKWLLELSILSFEEEEYKCEMVFSEDEVST